MDPMLIFRRTSTDEKCGPPPLGGFVTFVQNHMQSFLSKFEVLKKDDAWRSEKGFAFGVLVLAETELKKTLYIIHALLLHAVRPCKSTRHLELDSKCLGELSPSLTPVIRVLEMFSALPPLRKLSLLLSDMQVRLSLVETWMPWNAPSSPRPYECCFCTRDHSFEQAKGTAGGWEWILLGPICVPLINVNPNLYVLSVTVSPSV